MTSPESRIAKSFRPRSNPQALNFGLTYSDSGSSTHNEAKYLFVGVLNRYVIDMNILPI